MRVKAKPETPEWSMKIGNQWLEVQMVLMRYGDRPTTFIVVLKTDAKSRYVVGEIEPGQTCKHDLDLKVLAEKGVDLNSQEYLIATKDLDDWIVAKTVMDEL